MWTEHSKGVDFETYEVDLSNKSEKFLSVSPYGKVPVAVVDGASIYESNVVNEYLDETHEQKKLVPEDPAERAFMRVWMAFADDYFFPAVFAVAVGRERGFSEEKIKEGHEKLRDALSRLEAQLRDREYLVGEYSLADIAHAGNFARLRDLEERGDLSFGDHPNVAAWVERIEAREAYKAAV